MDRKYKVQRNANHTVKGFPKTLTSLGNFVGISSLTALYYGVITSPFMMNATEDVVLRDSLGTPLVLLGGLSLALGIDTIKNLKLERRQKKLQAKMNKMQEREDAKEDFIELYNKIEAQKRFNNITEQTRNI